MSDLNGGGPGAATAAAAVSESNGGSDGPVVVGLGPVDPALVVPYLPAGTVFIEQPSAGDLAVAEGAIVRAAYDVDRELLARMPRLRVVARTGVGVERVDLTATSERGIRVAVTPGSNARAVAEGAFAMLLSLVKRVGSSHAYVSGDRWGVDAHADPVPVPGDAFDKTLAVVGFGRIGRIIAGFGEAFGMRVIVHDPYVQSENYTNVSLEDAVREADALTLHLPGGEHELLPIEMLRRARGAGSTGVAGAAGTAETAELSGNIVPDQQGRSPLVLVNCARASLIRTQTLVLALEEGLLGGIGLDVFDEEPTRGHPLAGRSDVLLSPHTTGLSEAAMAATFQMAAEAVAAVLAGGEPSFTA